MRMIRNMSQMTKTKKVVMNQPHKPTAMDLQTLLKRYFIGNELGA